MRIPEKVNIIIETLTVAGYEAYAVGGCVRDTLLGKSPHDWDITTSANPMEIKELFSKTVDTGIKHGTVTVLLHGDQYEVTTYRIDGEYEDNRKPKSVEFTSSLIEDLKRRDFTINAMAYNPTDGLVDEFNSKQDLDNEIIRCVGDPNERFKEDALRMLRALRFTAQLGFDIEENTKEAIKNNVELLKNISAERIQVELTKLITSPRPNTLLLAYELGITKIILPEFDYCVITEQNNKYHLYNVAKHSLIAMENISESPVLRWTMLLHDIAKPISKTVDDKKVEHFFGHQKKGSEMAKVILRRLKLDSSTIDKVTRLIDHHDDKITNDDRMIRRAVNRIGEDIFEELLEVQKADALAKDVSLTSNRLKEINEVEESYKRIRELDQCISLKQLKVNGNDLKNLGVKQGKLIGEILGKLLNEVLDNPELNVKEMLIERANVFIQEY